MMSCVFYLKVTPIIFPFYFYIEYCFMQIIKNIFSLLLMKLPLLSVFEVISDDIPLL